MVIKSGTITQKVSNKSKKEKYAVNVINKSRKEEKSVATTEMGFVKEYISTYQKLR